MSDKPTIKLAVNYNKIRLIKNFISTTQTIKFLNVEFEFETPEWETLKKTVVFSRNDIAPICVPLNDGQTICEVPWEIFDDTKDCNCDIEYFVGVFGVALDGSRLPTNKIKLTMRQGCYEQGETPKEPTKDVYEILLANTITADEVQKMINDTLSAFTITPGGDMVADAGKII